MPKLESAADTRYQLQLPTVSFRIVEDDKSMLAPAGVHSEQSRSFGYNDFSDFERPEYYIRYIEPIESELAVQVEYDMDEQDQEWLDAVNAERKKEQSGPISYEIFEIIMDKLEKEWFNLVKRIPQPASHMPVEDSKCAICDDGEGENSNAIVFCDGCNLAVHQDCYGVPYIPEGQWLCRKCTVSPEVPVSCLFCPNEGGAFKQTTTGHWCHLLCAVWIPELTVANSIYMEPVTEMENMPKSRWKLVCALCRERVGACIQCDNRSCFTAFHVTCARQAGLLTPMKSVGLDGHLRGYCYKHLPAELRAEAEIDVDSDYSDTEIVTSRKRKRSGTLPPATAVTTKSARAHAKSYRPGPPIVPRLIVKQLEDYVAKIAIRKRHPFIERVCRYWSLKREARRGAPLLKRLHLEPWTASSTARQQTEADKAVKLKFLTMLRNDLDKVRMLAELARKRERDKLRQAQVVKDLVDRFLFPHDSKLRLVYEKISAMDRQDLFTHPVNRLEVPDYHDIIKEPMCWLAIDEKLEKNAYRNIEEFKRDMSLVLDNAMSYNASDHIYHKTAKRIKTNSKPLLDELDSLTSVSASENHDLPSAQLVGDLEAPLAILNLLTQNVPHEPEQDYLNSLFSFQLERPRPPTPTPPPSPPKKVQKKKTWAERKRKMEDRDAEHKARTEAGRTTRAGRAMAKAFAAEAGLPPSSDVEEPPSVEDTPRAGRANRRSKPTESVVADPRTSVSETTTSSAKRKDHRPVGVARFETVVRLSDKERRAQENQLDLVTDEVDNQDLFKRFNVGWVLPEGSKRKRPEKSEFLTSRPPTSARSKTSKTSRTSTTPAVTAHEAQPATEAEISQLDEVEAGPSKPEAKPIQIVTRNTSKSESLTPVSKRDSSLTPITSVVPTPTTEARATRATRTRIPTSQSNGSVASKGDRSGPNLSGLTTPIHARNEPILELKSKTRLSLRRGRNSGIEERPLTATSAQSSKLDGSEMTPVPDETPTPTVEPVSSSLDDENHEEEVIPSLTRSPTPTRPVNLRASSKGKGKRKSVGQRKGRGNDPDPEVEDMEQEEVLEDRRVELGAVNDDDQEGEYQQQEQAAERTAEEVDEREAEEEQEEDEEMSYKPGALVWAKLTGYPFFPAEVIDHEEQYSSLPKSVLKAEQTTRKQVKGAPIWLVRFYDSTSSYGWIPASRLDPLAVDDDIDAMYLAGKERGKQKGFKSSNMSKTVRQGYRLALASMEGAEEEGEEEQVEEIE